MMKPKHKAIFASAALITIFGVLASSNAKKNEDFVYLTSVKLRNIINAPPLNDKSIFYKGEFTELKHRGISALLNPNGIMVTDNLLNHYFIAGHKEINFTAALVYGNEDGEFRLCEVNNAHNCINVSTVTEYRNSLSAILEEKSNVRN